MNIVTKILTSFFVTAISISASADFQLPARVMYQGHDITTLAQHLNSDIKEFVRPFYFYHWYTGDNSDGSWNQITSARFPGGYNYAMSGARSYWQNYGRPTWATYGFGLYFSVDPEATRANFGGIFPVLLQVQLPRGTRYLDLQGRLQSVTNDDIQIFIDNKCISRVYYDPSHSIDQIFRGAASHTEPECKAFLTHLFDVVLQIDAFTYIYTSSYFRGIQSCGPQPNTALVLTSNRHIRRNNVRMFNPKTTDETENRILIQSIVLRASTGPAGNPSSYGYPSVIPNDISALWPDIAGHATTPNIDQWIHDNLYSCNGNQ